MDPLVSSARQAARAETALDDAVAAARVAGGVAGCDRRRAGNDPSGRPEAVLPPGTGPRLV